MINNQLQSKTSTSQYLRFLVPFLTDPKLLLELLLQPHPLPKRHRIQQHFSSVTLTHFHGFMNDSLHQGSI